MDKTLLVLAAGMGSRYGGLKQMDGFGPNGETILEYSVYDALKAGFTDIVFVIRKSIKADFKSCILDRLPKSINVRVCFQELDVLPEGFSVPSDRSKPWGTGHAVWVAKDIVRSPFALVNGDDFYGRNSFLNMGKYFDSNPVWNHKHAMVAYDLGRTLSPYGSVSRGLCELDENSRLIGLEEISEIKRTEEKLLGVREGGAFEIADKAQVSMNLFGFYPEVFDAIERDLISFIKSSGNELKSEFYIPSVVNELISSGEASIDVLNTDEEWLGVTNPQDKQYVIEGIQKHIDSGKYPSNLWADF